MAQGDKIQQYRIGDYSHYMGVTRDFLKHYEQFRLLSSVTTDNGYRYYPFNQSYKILECMRLRNYGFSIKDMDVILNDDDGETVLHKLNQQTEEIRRRIEFDQALLEEQLRFSQWLTKMNRKTSDWYVMEGEELYFLPHSNRYHFLEDERIYTILNDWVNWMPMVKSSMEIRYDKNDIGENRDYSWGLIVRKDFADRYHIPLNGAVKLLPKRKVFVYSFSHSYSLNREKELHSNPRHPVWQKMQEMGLEPTGDIYKIIFMYTHVNEFPSGQYGVFLAPAE